MLVNATNALDGEPSEKPAKTGDPPQQRRLEVRWKNLFDGVDLKDYPAVFAAYVRECKLHLWYHAVAVLVKTHGVTTSECEDLRHYFECWEFCQHEVKWYYIDRRVGWTKDGMPHRDGDEPAEIWVNGSRQWYKHGELHRDGDEPAEIWANGARQWYKHGELHRDSDKPAKIWANGTRQWYQNGKLHRDDDKPAMICARGALAWYQHGELHRDGDKPAEIWPDGSRKWYLHGVQYCPNKENV